MIVCNDCFYSTKCRIEQFEVLPWPTRSMRENRTHDTSFVGFRALYPLSRKETTHSSIVVATTSIGQALRGGHEKSIVGKKFRCQFGNDANFEIMPI